MKWWFVSCSLPCCCLCILGIMISLLLHVHDVESSIYCWQCTSLADPSCGTNNPNKSLLRLCDGHSNITEDETFVQLLDSSNSIGGNNGTGDDDEFEFEHPMAVDVDVEIDYKLCRKTIVHLYTKLYSGTAESKWSVYVVRQCGYVSDPEFDNKCVRRKSATLEQTMCSCNEDACNGSPAGARLGRVNVNELWGRWHWIVVLLLSLHRIYT